MKAAFNWRLSAVEMLLIADVLPDIEIQAAVAAQMEEGTTAWQRRQAPDEFLPLARDAEIFIALSMVPTHVFAAANSLRFVSSLEHGVNWLPFDLLIQRDVQVANAKGARDSLIAEQAFALVLACAKRLYRDMRAVRKARYQQNWVKGEMASRLAGETVGIVGLGGIGRQVARRAKAFEMRVVGVRRHPEPAADVDCVYGPDRLRDLLAESRFVVLVAPYTPDTHRMMNNTTLRFMRADGYLINMARAALVDEHALHGALVEGRIAGYASDVWWDYGHTHFGVPSRDGIHRLPNVIGTGDRSINVPGDWERVLRFGLDNVRAFLDGDPILRAVDLSLGY